MSAVLPARELVIAPGPAAYFGAGAIARLPATVQAAGETAVLVTDAALAATRVVPAVIAVLEGAGIGVSMFSGVHPNPTTQDLADGAAAVEAAGPGRPVLAMATTGLGACHAIGHALGGRYGIAHGVALSLVLPQVLAFTPACTDRLADVAFALGAGHTARTAQANAGAAIEAVGSLVAGLGLTGQLADFGIAAADFGQIAADALDDEVLMNAPRQPSAADVAAMLAGAGAGPAARPALTGMDDDAVTGTDDACPERSWS